MNIPQYKKFILITGQTLFYYKVLCIYIYQNRSNEFKTVFLYHLALDVHLKYRFIEMTLYITWSSE